mmetsp:Transcript_58772/g.108489  ORF Transcript_58772/g.108489 Transcript_58772/m.108489 type:complete len:627 (-) Transcript_58772:51-1931(-)
MVVFISRFEWEAVKSPQSMRSHTEYLIELCVQFDVPTETGTSAEEGEVPKVLSASWTIRRRYTDFFNCHSQLSTLSLGAIPSLPPKEPVIQRMVGTTKSRSEWQEVRRESLKQYVTELLAHEDLLELLPVQNLLACGPLVRLNRPPQAPASVRARLVGADPAEGEASQEGKLTKGLEILVKPAQAPRLSHGDLFAIDQLPVKEVIVVFRDIPDEDVEPGRLPTLHGGEEVAARAYLPVTSACEEVGAFVELPAGRSYAIEAFSVSVAGVQSAAVSLVARVPAVEEAKVILAAIEAERSELISAVGGRSLSELSNESFDGLENMHAEISNASGNSEASKRQSAIRRNTVRKEQRGAFGFRGSVAAEYVAAASEKNRQLYEKAPHILHRSSKGGISNEEVMRPRQSFVQVEVNAIKQATEDLEKLHRDAQVLDQERLQSNWSERLAEADAALTWILQVTGASAPSSEANEAEDDEPTPYGALQIALSSGVLLCELVNQLAALGGDSAPIPTYHRKPTTKFKSMENVSKFIAACREHFKMPEAQLFGTLALAEGRDMQAVIKCVVALAARMQVVYPNYAGPQLAVAKSGRRISSNTDLAGRESTSNSDPAEEGKVVTTKSQPDQSSLAA